MMLRQVDFYKQKIEVGALCYIIYKNKLKWVNDLNIRAET